MDGVEVIEGLRGWSRVPIIVLSARDAEAAKIAALDAGRRRLRDQAVRHGRAARPGPGRAAPHRRRRRRRRRHRGHGRLHRSISRPSGCTVTVRRCTSRRRSGTCSRCSCAAPAGSSSQRQLLQEVWGPQYEHGDELPPPLPGAAASQARARAEPAPLPPHRTRHGLPLRAGVVDLKDGAGGLRGASSSTRQGAVKIGRCGVRKPQRRIELGRAVHTSVTRTAGSRARRGGQRARARGRLALVSSEVRCTARRSPSSSR